MIKSTINLSCTHCSAHYSIATSSEVGVNAWGFFQLPYEWQTKEGSIILCPDCKKKEDQRQAEAALEEFNQTEEVV